jgi:hypothetical protein
VLLRLAVLFNRSRTDSTSLNIICSGNSNKFSLALSDDQRAANPLTWADLERENNYLASVGIKMKLIESAAD